MKFSVIIPVFNGENYISNTIESVLFQTFKDWELIIVDDGSNDSTAQICKNYSNKYQNIIFIKQENAGPYEARINGYHKSSGNWILFLDSDDLLKKNCLFTINKSITNNPQADIFIFGYDHIDFESKVKLKHKPSENFSSLISSNKPLEQFFCKSMSFYVWDKCFKRDLLENTNFYNFNGPILKLSEDALMTFEISKNSKSLIKIEDIIYFHQSKVNSLSKIPSNEDINFSKNVFFYIYSNLKKMNFSNLIIKEIYDLFIKHLLASSKNKNYKIFKSDCEKIFTLEFLINFKFKGKSNLIIFLLKCKFYHLLFLVFRISTFSIKIS